jgi:hypothetical protein
MQQHSKFPLFALLALLCVIAEGCAPSWNIFVPGQNPTQTEEIARQSAMTSAYIIFHDGDTVKGYQVGVRSDTTEWFEKDSTGIVSSAVRYVAPTSDISSISLSTPRPLEDMLIGAGVGAALGAIIYGVAKIPDPPGEYQDLGTEFINWIARGAGFEGCTIGMAAIGGIVGLESGTNMRKSYDVEVIDTSARQPIHWFNAQTDTVTVDTTVKADTNKLR